MEAHYHGIASSFSFWGESSWLTKLYQIYMGLWPVLLNAFSVNRRFLGDFVEWWLFTWSQIYLASWYYAILGKSFCYLAITKRWCPTWRSWTKCRINTLPNLSRFGCSIMLYPRSLPFNLYLYPSSGQKPKASQSGKCVIKTGQRTIRRLVKNWRGTLNPIRSA